MEHAPLCTNSNNQQLQNQTGLYCSVKRRLETCWTDKHRTGLWLAVFRKSCWHSRNHVDLKVPFCTNLWTLLCKLNAVFIHITLSVGPRTGPGNPGEYFVQTGVQLHIHIWRKDQFGIFRSTCQGPPPTEHHDLVLNLANKAWFETDPTYFITETYISDHSDNSEDLGSFLLHFSWLSGKFAWQLLDSQQLSKAPKQVFGESKKWSPLKLLSALLYSIIHTLHWIHMLCLEEADGDKHKETDPEPRDRKQKEIFSKLRLLLIDELN